MIVGRAIASLLHLPLLALVGIMYAAVLHGMVT